MKQLVTLCFCLFAFAKAYSQQPNALDATLEDANPAGQMTPTETIKEFFKHFNAKDAKAVEGMMSPELVLHSLTISASKGRKMTTTTVQEFIKNLAEIPEDQVIEERIVEFSSAASKDHATVKTNYEFYVNGKFTHNGTNIFTLFLIDGKWHIVGLADTRLYK